MRQVFIVFVFAMAMFSHTLSSFGGTEDLASMVESKSFWAAYNWSNYEESELYNTVSWKRMPSEVTDNIKSYVYSSPVFEISSFGSTFIHLNLVLPDKNVLWIDLFNTLSQDDQFYKRFVSWCDEKFGNNHVEKKRDWEEGKGRRQIFSSSWELENTRVVVVLDRDSSNGENPPKCFTQLKFMPNK